MDTNIKEAFEEALAKIRMRVPQKCLNCEDFFTGEHCKECDAWFPEEPKG